MPNLSTQQLADLLIGIARAQAAVIQGIESAVPGARGTHIAPALQNVAHLHDRPDPSLIDLPVRVLMSSLGRIGPDAANIARELDRLFGDAPPVAVPSEPAATPAASASGDEELDFSKS
ncbi:MAG: hypothetical protein O2975_03115 [Proteobacteria bacterium]|nr:hypothetical protein [Pseudomonadota bacterium]